MQIPLLPAYTSWNLCVLYNIRIWRKFAHICPSLYGFGEGTCLSLRQTGCWARLYSRSALSDPKNKTNKSATIFSEVKARHRDARLAVTSKKEMHTFTNSSEKISARWCRTHNNINTFMKAVCLFAPLKCCFKKPPVLLCVESTLATLWSTKYVCTRKINNSAVSFRKIIV